MCCPRSFKFSICLSPGLLEPRLRRGVLVHVQGVGCKWSIMNRNKAVAKVSEKAVEMICSPLASCRLQTSHPRQHKQPTVHLLTSTFLASKESRDLFRMIKYFSSRLLQPCWTTIFWWRLLLLCWMKDAICSHVARNTTWQSGNKQRKPQLEGKKTGRALGMGDFLVLLRIVRTAVYSWV